MHDINKVRRAIISSLPDEVAAESTAQLRSGEIYFPPSHLKALRLESSLVVGGRGVGKTFWTKVLGKQELKDTLIRLLPDMRNTEVKIGFSFSEDIIAYPTRNLFSQLLESGFDPEIIWTSVVVRWLANVLNKSIPIGSWDDTARWVKEHPEKEALLFHEANERFQKIGKRGLIIFDSLDRTSNDWVTMNRLSQGLLKMILRLKGFGALYGKVFFREDQLTNTAMNFPDASKLQATRCDLTWQLHDLHGLLWQSLCNAPNKNGDILRKVYKTYDDKLTNDNGVWRISDAAMRQGELQKSLFHSLSGPYMGKDKRRGVPYIWTVSHLADSNQRTSPRSFLVAIKAASMDSLEKYFTNYDEFPLHYESIKRGVQRASSVRVREISEDYPWVELLFEPLQGRFNVPVDFSIIENLWQEAFPGGIGKQEKLPPQNDGYGWIGVRKQLEHLGLCEVMRDGRVNMPDLYRVAFRIGRKGGVRPVTDR